MKYVGTLPNKYHILATFLGNVLNLLMPQNSYYKTDIKRKMPHTFFPFFCFLYI